MEPRGGAFVVSRSCALILETPYRHVPIYESNRWGRSSLSTTNRLSPGPSRRSAEGGGVLDGHRVERREDGFKRAGQRTPDVIVLDVRLPRHRRAQGGRALQGDRSAGGGAHIVIITAFGSFDVAVRAVESGAFDYLRSRSISSRRSWSSSGPSRASRPPVGWSSRTTCRRRRR